MRIDIVADLICPWCFIGKRRLEQAMALRPEIAFTRAWRPFQLNPDMPTEGMPQPLYLAGKFGAARNAARLRAGIVAAGNGVGIDFAFDRIRRAPNTLAAHRLLRRARAEGCEDDIAEALYCAYFLDGSDIGDLETLVALAAGIGLGRAATRRYLAGDTGAAEVLDEDRRARRLGIHAVPCFILAGGHAIAGAQEPEMFLPLFDLASESAKHAGVAV